MTKSGKTKSAGVNAPKPLLVVFSAPSGAGKSTIVDLLIKRDRRFYKSVSATTRAKRKGEREERDYFFLTPEEFRNKSAKGEFIETAKVFKEQYGTPKEPVLRALKAGRTVLFDIDIQGGMAVKRWRRDAVLIFILPPGLAVLKQRLSKRGSESEASLKLRLARALKEIKFWSKYDYVVCNEKLDETVDLILTIIRAESQRGARFDTIPF